MRRVAIIILSIVTLVILFFVLCTFRVRPYEETILVRFGRVIPPDQQTRIAWGWYLCLPTDVVVPMDKRLHLKKSMLVEMGTRSKDPVSVQAFAAWRIVDPRVFYEKFQGDDERAQSALDGKVMAQVGEVLGRHSLDEFFSAKVVADTQAVDTQSDAHTQAAQESTELSAAERMEQEITRQVSAEMKPLGVEVAQVGFARLGFSHLVAQSIYDRMSKERQELAAKYRGEGDTLAANIRTEADGLAKDARSNADREALATRGAGEAQAQQILSDAQNTPEKRSFFQFLREMDVMKSSIGKNAYLMLKTNQSPFDVFFNGSQPPANPTDNK